VTHCSAEPPASKRLRREIDEGFEGIELPAASAKPALESQHSVVTIRLVDQQTEPTRAPVHPVVGFLKQRLPEHGEATAQAPT